MAKRVPGEHLTLKDMIRGSGCTPRTVRYYEREGLLRAERSTGGHRLFAASELDRLNFIIALREAGWSLEEITSLLAIRSRARADQSATQELESIVDEQISRLNHKIAILNRLLGDLTETQSVLRICRTCTEPSDPQRCASCERLPVELPTGFRLTWLADERRKPEPGDEG